MSERTPEREIEAPASEPPTLPARSSHRAPVGVRMPVVGGRLGNLDLLRILGSGGMGKVYEAYDPELDRNVAVKVMTAQVAMQSEWGAFVAEARITGQLEHPSIVPLYGMGVTDSGLVYLVMRKVDGVSLQKVLHDLADGEDGIEERWPRPRLLRAFLQVCEAAGYAHSRGVIHRDLKPANVMLGAYGETLVLDWGVARRYADGTPDRFAEGGTGIVGTPGYMSPEQAAGRQDLDPRTDVWSLGAILYEILTHEPAYVGEQALSLLVRTMEGAPTSPPLRAPELGIPEELSDICNTAVAKDPDKRFQSAGELAEAVQGFLEGTKRRAEAERQLERARNVWASYLELGQTRDQLLLDEKRFADAADAWAPLSERGDLLLARDALDELEPKRARIFGEFIGLCEKALAHLPDHAGARAVLAGAYWDRLQAAEERRDPAQIAYYHDRVSVFDDGTYAALLEGTGAVSLRTDPSGAEVLCERFEQRGLVYPLVERRVLGETPLTQLTIAMGSYLLTIRLEGKRDVRYPIRIDRTQHWDSGADPVRLYDDDEIGEDFVYVPAGPFLGAGDPDAPGSGPSVETWLGAFSIARLPVTMQQYTAFLNKVHLNDPADAWRRCPRSESSLSVSEGQYLKRPRTDGVYTLPQTGPDGDDWDPTWPVFGISWHDAIAYAAWASERDGVTYRLPKEWEIEKAARGVDGRFYPWGDRFDRTLCKMGDSRRGPPRPEPVGAFPNDVSVYGAHDLAGSMRDWCGDDQFDGDATLRPVRGGSWNYDPRFCRAACRLGRAPWRIFAYNGFRLARDA